MKRIEIKLSNFFSRNIKSYKVVMGCALMLFQISCNNTDDSVDCNGNNNGKVCNSTPTVSASTVSTQGTFNAIDRVFIDSAAASGMAEVTLGQLAANSAFNNSVRAFGQQMVNEHTDANNQLMSIASRNNIMPPAQIDPAHRALIIRLTTYTGYQFDTAYLNSQVMDHMKAINLFQGESNNIGGDPAVRGFANSNLPNLNRHQYVADSLLNTLNTGAVPGAGGNTNGSTRGTTSGSGVMINGTPVIGSTTGSSYGNF
jgi:putative membrane protein